MRPAMRASLSRAWNGYLAPEEYFCKQRAAPSALLPRKNFCNRQAASLNLLSYTSVPVGLLDQRRNVRLGQPHDQSRRRPKLRGTPRRSSIALSRPSL
eukprot:1780319-Pleurochrysis_carterae.AAC.1